LAEGTSALNVTLLGLLLTAIVAEEEGVEDVEGGDVSAPLPYHDMMGACSGRAAVNKAALMLSTMK